MKTPASPARTLAMLRMRVLEEGILMTSDERIAAPDAARLLGFHKDSLRRMRRTGRGPIFFNRHVAKASISYRLGDLAAWIVEHRSNTIGEAPVVNVHFDNRPTATSTIDVELLAQLFASELRERIERRL